jgi:membrane peptidoglycan carboxypeptidase
VTLWQLTAAYAGLARGGSVVRPYLIEEVRDAQGRLLYAHLPPPSRQALDPRVAYLVTDVLSDPAARIPSFGYGSMLELPFPAAVKTGTTNNWRDNWTVGYTSQWTVGVWVGNADNTPMERATGITGAAPIWNAVMRYLHPSTPPAIPRPEGLVEVEVCAASGKLPGPACAHRRRELFLPDHAPTETCDMHSLVALDALTGEPATEATPPERRILKTVTNWPADALQWALDQGLARPPARGAEPPRTALAGSTAGSAPYLASPDHRGVYRVSVELPPDQQRLQIVAVCPACQAGDALSLWSNGALLVTWTAPPYRTLWQLAEGEHQLAVVHHPTGSQPVQSAYVEISVIAETTTRGEAP